MCGYVGIFDSELRGRVEARVGNAMRFALKHRGPDGHGDWADAHIYVGHNRLSIVDLSEQGLQPFFSEDNQILSAFNGEIYNFLEIKKDLISKGHEFLGHSDGEIIPHLYEEYGVEFVSKLRGMFSIAVVDRRKHQLLLVRDRFGIKPLYYAELSGLVYFASEIKSLLEIPELSREVDYQAIHEFLGFSYIPDPSTAFKKIRSLEAAHMMIFKKDRSSVARYWNFSEDPPKEISKTEAVERAEEIFSKAVSRQLMSDVPLGTFLSGGVDSSLVTAYAARAYPGVLPTFCVKFPDQSYDESPYARMAAETCRTNHHEIFIPARSADPALIERLLLHFDQPFGDSSLIPTYLVCREMRAHVKVALSGDGGDEVFGGYEIFWQLPFIRKVAGWPRPIRTAMFASMKRMVNLFPNDLFLRICRVLDMSFQELPDTFCTMQSYLSESQRVELYNSSVFEGILRSSRIFEHLSDFGVGVSEESLYRFISQCLFRRSLPGDMLTKVDRMSMLTGLEVRVPFLDEDVVDFAWTLPRNIKVYGSEGKWVLRQILAKYFPRALVNKKKWGFGIPLDTVASSEFNVYLRDVLLSPRAKISSFVDKKITENWVRSFVAQTPQWGEISRQGLYQRIFMLLSLELWLKHKTTHISEQFHHAQKVVS